MSIAYKETWKGSFKVSPSKSSTFSGNPETVFFVGTGNSRDGLHSGTGNAGTCGSP